VTSPTSIVNRALLIALCALVAITIHTMFYSAATGPEFSIQKLGFAIIYLAPLIPVALGVAFGRQRPIAVGAAIFSLAVGGWVEYVFYTTNDPTGSFTFLISLAAFCISGFLACFSFVNWGPTPKH